MRFLLTKFICTGECCLQKEEVYAISGRNVCFVNVHCTPNCNLAEMAATLLPIGNCRPKSLLRFRSIAPSRMLGFSIKFAENKFVAIGPSARKSLNLPRKAFFYEAIRRTAS